MARILLIDDDSAARTMFSRALTHLAEIRQAPSGSEGLVMLEEQRYDLVLLDLHMPVLDGFDVLELLAKSAGPNRDTPVYVVSADTSEDSRLRAMRRRGVFFLTKPIPIAALVGLVDSALRRASELPRRMP